MFSAVLVDCAAGADSSKQDHEPNKCHLTLSAEKPKLRLIHGLEISIADWVRAFTLWCQIQEFATKKKKLDFPFQYIHRLLKQQRYVLLLCK